MGNKKGICTLCGVGAKLTFEHIPPESAFNIPGVEMFGFDEWRARDKETGAMTGGRLQPRGTGRFALCETCNPALGRWYVPAFAKFALAGMQVLEGVASQLGALDADPNPRFLTVVLHEVDRLLVAKQIVSMLACTTGRSVMERHPAILEYLRDPSARGLPSDYRLFLSINAGPALSRSSGLCVMADEWEMKLFTEFLYMPWGYALSLNGTTVYEAGEITSWLDAEPGESIVKDLRVLVGFVHTVLPGVMKSRAALALQTRENVDPRSENI